MHNETGESNGGEAGASWLDRVNDAYYDRLSERMGRKTRERINWMCAQCDGRSVLDIGCSQGITSILLGREGFNALGIDITSEAIEFANAELASEPAEVRERVRFQRLDLLSMPVEGGFDNVILGEVVEHQTSAARFLKAAKQHVAPGGRMIVTVPYGLHPFPDHKCTVFPRDLVDALKGFGIAKIEVFDGYLRAVAIRDSELLLDRDAVLDVTEHGAMAAQQAYFEHLDASRRSETRRREVGEKLAVSEKARRSALTELEQLRSQLMVMRNEVLSGAEEIGGLRAGNLDLSAQLDSLARQHRDALAAAKACEAALSGRASRAESEKSNLQARYEKKIAQMADYRRRLEHQHATVKSWYEGAGSELAAMRQSTSFRVGYALVVAFRSPKDFIALPVRLGRAVVAAVRRRSSRRAEGRGSSAKEEDPGLVWRDGFAGEVTPNAEPASGFRPVVSSVLAVPLSSDRVPMLPPLDIEPVAVVPGRDLPTRVSELKVAAIMDDFTRESFRNCCDLRQLTPNGWRDELAAFQPHLVLVESAWKGEGKLWAQKIYPLSVELMEMLTWAREQGIPTAFWNKEDPVHFSVFLPTARQFDHVFTTDVDCIKSYRAELGHDRVHLLPFACEPRKHNPLEVFDRIEGFCFAGSYYVKYPERQRDFSSLVDTLRKVAEVDIYDRNHGTDEASLVFPLQYQPLVKGNLPYDQIDKAYKGYRYGININTVKQSQSMFARRAFDLMSSNTVVVSNYSRAMRLLFGDLAFTSDQGEEVMRRLAPLLANEVFYRNFRLQALRKVLSEHTYEDRLAFVMQQVGGARPEVELPVVTVVGRVESREDWVRLSASFNRQVYTRKRLVVVVPEGADAGAWGMPAHVEVTHPGALAGLLQTGYAGFFRSGDYYGPSYLLDLALATRYSDAVVIGKSAHYATSGGDSTRLLNGGTQYRSCGEFDAGACIVRFADAPDLSVLSLHEAGVLRLSDPATGLATDEFNYCRGWSGDECPDVDDIRLYTGMPLAKLQALAEVSSGGGSDRGGEAMMLSGFGPAELATLFKAGDYSEGRLHLAHSPDGLVLSSKLQPGKYSYIYADAPVAVDVLFPEEIGRFNMLVSSDMLLSFTLIFLDAAQKRIGHVIRACNSNQGLVPLEGTRYVLLGFRAQGPGIASLRKLVLQHVPAEVDAIAGRGRQLVVTRGYPSYTDLYNYSFVHRRVQGYVRRAMDVDVFQLGNAPLSYDEFEDVDVVRGSVGDLALMLDSNPYHVIMVHSFDEQVWTAVEGVLDRVRVVVWVHGAEIQPWYRRDFNHGDDGERKRAIQRSNMRMDLWRRVLAAGHDNLHLVFVSEFLARQAMSDVGVWLPSGGYSVIHNFVDGEFFTYQEKAPELRNRVLSIRPYSHRTYANDLMVKAIVDVSREPWFEQMQFSVFGDGTLFDETLEPLRQFPNVRIERRFLSRHEIRELHRTHGVFLVPSRIDSQGVSRDEAMASGLVPVTNRIAAIPEFVDETSGVLVDPEDWRGLAEGLRNLHVDARLFGRLSREAARRVRDQSSEAQTIDREIALVQQGAVYASDRDSHVVRRRIAVYGDLNINLMDGSAVWAASLVEVLAEVEGVEVDLFLKTPLENTRVLDAVIRLSGVRIIEPRVQSGTRLLSPRDATISVVGEDASRHYDAIVLRGFDVCLEAGSAPSLKSRIWSYLTDIPQQDEGLDADWRRRIAHIAAASRYVLCQTSSFEALLNRCAPATVGKTRRLPPMVPDHEVFRRADRLPGPLRIAYAGKFAPAWGIREMLDLADALRDAAIDFELHVYGDKIHNPAEDPEFRAEVRSRLESSADIIWHGAQPRATVLAALATMDLGWAWRHAALERTTLELSTKLLEYGLAGLPAIMSPGPANHEAFGEDYPLFARDYGELLELVSSVASGHQGLGEAADRMSSVARLHTFDAVRRERIVPLLAAINAQESVD